MKNTPITERVNAGLFKQKGLKTTEPLLNVGPAGVRGNNKTKNVTSPAKSTPGEKDKPKTKVGVNVSKTTTVAGDILTGKKGDKGETIHTTGKSLKGLTPEQLDWRNNEIEKLGGLDGYHKKWGNKKTGKARVVGATADEPDTQGPDIESTTNEFVATQKRENNSSLNPWEVRQQSRGVKKSGKDQRQAGNKLDRINRRIGKMKKEDQVVGNKKFDRLSRKKTENTNELDAFDKNMTARTRQVEVSANAANKDKFKGASIDNELGDFADGGASKIKSGDIKTTNNKKTEGFFKKKSPMKMKYFK